MATTTNFGWETPDDTDLVKDGALAMRTLGNAIDASLVDLKGGTTGQVLSKNSNTDMDFTWVTSDDANAIQNAIVDAKGDLITATAADTPARLAVGNNGETLVVDSSTSTGLRYNPQNALANPVINGGMDIWQRGTSISIAASSGTTYLADRWATATSANQAATISRQTTSDTTNLPNVQYALKVQRNSGQTGTAGWAVVQNFETTNTYPFVGKTITMSFYAKKGANFAGTFRAVAWNGTGTDQNILSGFTGQNLIAYETHTLTTSWQRFVSVITIPTNATQFALGFEWTPSGTAGADDSYQVTGVQIDVGTYTASSAPTFRRSGGTLAGELAACQRYYFRYSGTGFAQYAVGMSTTTTAAVIQLSYPAQMRTVPTSVDYSNLEISDLNAYALAVNTLSLSSGSVGVNVARLDIGNATGATANRTAFLRGNNSPSFIGLSAEL